ncbi:MAG: hypothetical protein U0935_13260 [Pirellulales bacterium]
MEQRPLPPPTLPAGAPGLLVARLTGVRSVLRRRLLMAVVLRSLWGAAAWAVVSLVLDYTCQLGGMARTLLLLLAAGSLLAAVVWSVRLVVWQIPSLAALARLAEQRYPACDGCLVNAVEWNLPAAELQQLGERTGASVEMLLATVAQGEQWAQHLPWDELLDDRWSRRQTWGLVATVAVGVAVVIAGARNESATLWARRAFLVDHRPYPRQVRIEVEGVRDGELVWARGTSGQVRFRLQRADGQLPSPPQVTFWPRRSHTLTTVTRGPAPEYQLTVRDVLEPFLLRIRADDASADVRLRLADPPALRSWTLRVEPPRYTGEEPRELLAGQGPFRVLRGSRLTLAGTVSKPLMQAHLLAGTHRLPLQVEGGRAADGGSRFRGQVEADQWGEGMLSLTVRDTDGLDFPRAPAVRLEPLDDRPPEVAVTWRGASRLIVATGQLSHAVRLSDDFAVTQVQLRARVADAAGVELHPWSSLESEFPANTLPTRNGELAGRIDVRPLQLAPGMVLSLAWEVRDNCAVGGPHTSLSAERTWSVVSAEELRSDWLRREKEQRQQLEQLLADWEQWRLALPEAVPVEKPAGTELARGGTGAGELDERLERARKQLVSLTESVADRRRELVMVWEEVGHSGLEASRGPLVERLETRIIPPLQEVVDELLPALARRVRSWRDSLTSPMAATAGRTACLAQADEIAARLRTVIRELARIEGLQEAVRLVEELRDEQQEIMLNTQEIRRRRVAEILEAPAAGAPPAAPSPPRPAPPRPLMP